MGSDTMDLTMGSDTTVADTMGSDPMIRHVR